MQRVTHNQEEIQKAIDEGKAETRDLSTIIKGVLMDILPQELREQITIEANSQILDAYLSVEKTYDPIPWINPSDVIVCEIPSRIVYDKKAQKSEATRLKEAGFPGHEINDVLQTYIVADKKKREEVEASGQVYTRPETFVFTWTKPEGKKGVLVTEMDRVHCVIYSVATSVDVGMPLRKQYNYFKSILMYLLGEMPFSLDITSLEYAYETTHSNRLHFFIVIK